MAEEMNLTESLEDYLEIILELEQTQKVARAKDIAEKLNVQRGSVTGALKNLEKKGLINYEPYSFITLTRKGVKIAKDIRYRHDILKKFLLNVLQIDKDTAETTACRMEHAVDEQVINRLVNFIDYVYNCPRAGEDWIQFFIDHCSAKNFDEDKCSECLDKCKADFENQKTD